MERHAGHISCVKVTSNNHEHVLGAVGLTSGQTGGGLGTSRCVDAGLAFVECLRRLESRCHWTCTVAYTCVWYVVFPPQDWMV